VVGETTSSFALRSAIGHDCDSYDGASG